MSKPPQLNPRDVPEPDPEPDPVLAPNSASGPPPTTPPDDNLDLPDLESTPTDPIVPDDIAAVSADFAAYQLGKPALPLDNLPDGATLPPRRAEEPSWQVPAARIDAPVLIRLALVGAVLLLGSVTAVALLTNSPSTVRYFSAFGVTARSSATPGSSPTQRPPTATLAATALSTATQPVPTATSPGVLQVDAGKSTGFPCKDPKAVATITLNNAGGQPLNWSVKVSDGGVSADPTYGTLAPGASATVTVSGIPHSGPFMVDVTAEDGTHQVAFTCV